MKIDKGLDHRGIWRAVYTSLWNDPEFRKLTVSEKLVFLNLRTGPQTNLPVIFCYYVQPINQQTGVGMRSVRSALCTLEEKNWIQIEDGIVWIKKGLKFDPNIVLSNDKHLIAIRNVILSLPKLQIVRDFIDYYKIDMPYPIPSRIPYGIAYGNQEKDTEKEKDTEEEEEKDSKEEGKPKVNPLSLFKGEHKTKSKKTYYPAEALSREEKMQREEDWQMERDRQLGEAKSRGLI